jgi:hypothetical protein
MIYVPAKLSQAERLCNRPVESFISTEINGDWLRFQAAGLLRDHSERLMRRTFERRILAISCTRSEV